MCVEVGLGRRVIPEPPPLRRLHWNQPMPYRDNRGCPVCGSPLAAYRTRDYSYERCDRCHGIWMSIALLNQMCAEIVPAPIVAFEAYDGAGQRGCPDCGRVMQRASLFEIPVDVCQVRTDGVWLDKDELKQVLDRVAETDPRPPDPPSSFTSLLDDFLTQTTPLVAVGGGAVQTAWRFRSSHSPAAATAAKEASPVTLSTTVDRGTEP